MTLLFEKHKISNRDLLYNVVANVTHYSEFNETDLRKHEEIFEKRKLMFSNSPKDSIDNLSEVKDSYLGQRLYKLSKNIRQNIDLRDLDRFFVICIISTLLTTIVTSYLTFNNLANVGILNIAPFSIFIYKCLIIEKSTKRYNVIYNYLIEQHEKKKIAPDNLLVEVNETTLIDLELNEEKKKVLNRCIYYLIKDNLIDTVNLDIENECLESTANNKLLTTQIDFVRSLSHYIKSGQIILKGEYKAISECISNNMYQKNGIAINSSSFEVQLNMILNQKG